MLTRQTDMKIPAELIPRCPACGKSMTMNLRADDTLVQDKEWYQTGERYSDFIRSHKGVLSADFGTWRWYEYPKYY